MRSFRTFFKTKVGRKSQSEVGGEVKSAGDGYDAGAASIRNAFGGGGDVSSEAPPAPSPAPANVSPDTGSLGGNISGAISRFLGK